MPFSDEVLTIARRTATSVLETNEVEVIEKAPEIVKPVIVATPVTAIVNESALYAQPITNGYQLVDTTPKVVFILQKTSVENVFLIKGRDGTVFLNDGQWIAEYYEGDELKKELLNIKF